MMCKKTFAQKRQIINSIPDGIYCYDLVSVCPYWKGLRRQRGKCVLLGIKDDFSQDSFILLWDQVKVCSYKNPLK
jgi:hypothetical protein